MAKLEADWGKAPYSDKIRTSTINGMTTFYYKFEGPLAEFVTIDNEGKITYDTFLEIKRYKVGLLLKLRFINFANKTNQEKKDRFSSYRRDNSYNWGSAGSGKTSSGSTSGTTSGSSASSSSVTAKEPRYKNPFVTKGRLSIHCKHPRWDLYQTLIITVVSRAEQLNNLPNNSDDRFNLENEFNATIGRVKEMKEKYHFD